MRSLVVLSTRVHKKPTFSVELKCFQAEGVEALLNIHFEFRRYHGVESQTDVVMSR